MAMAFLNDIVDLAVNIASVQEDTIGSDNVVDGTTSSIVSSSRAQLSFVEGRLLNVNGSNSEKKASAINVDFCECYNDEESIELDADCIPSESESSCDSTQDYYDDEISNHAECVDMITTGPPSNNGALRRQDLTCNLQNSFLFTETQSTRFYQWLCNAANASRKNKPPSKSAVKLHSLKSKKQKQKELKMERKTKKKK